jgi:hypothetical protein
MPLPSQRPKADYRLRTTDNRLSTVPFVVSMSFGAPDLQPLCLGLLPLFTFQCSLHLNSSVPIIRKAGWAVKGNLGTIDLAARRAGPRAAYLSLPPSDIAGPVGRARHADFLQQQQAQSVYGKARRPRNSRRRLLAIGTRM